MADVYGTPQLYDDIRDKLKAGIDALLVIMATGYTPTFNYAYDDHEVAGLKINAMTVGIESSESEETHASSVSLVFTHHVIASIRVHTAYDSGQPNRVVNGRLLNSIQNYLLLNADLLDGYRVVGIEDVVTSTTFDDSHTMGGELRVIIKKITEYVQ